MEKTNTKTRRFSNSTRSYSDLYKIKTKINSTVNNHGTSQFIIEELLSLTDGFRVVHFK